MGILLFLVIITNFGFNHLYSNFTKPQVQGVATNVPTPTATPIPESTPKPTSIPTPTNTPIPAKPQNTTRTKQYGGWYWQPDLGRAQRWLGLDSEGKDIWSDTGDPTPTPTPSSAPSYPNSQNSHGITEEIVSYRSATGSGSIRKSSSRILKERKQ